MRSGIESTNSGLKNRLGMGRLRVRGRPGVYRVIQHKIAGWNVLRASALAKMREVVAQRMSEACHWREPGRLGWFLACVKRLKWNLNDALGMIWPDLNQNWLADAA